MKHQIHIDWEYIICKLIELGANIILNISQQYYDNERREWNDIIRINRNHNLFQENRLISFKNDTRYV